MCDKTEKELNKIGATLKEIPKPSNINEYVQKGISMGMKKKRVQRLKVISNIAAVLILAVFITSVRTIPVFAEYVSKIPGLEHIVNLINHDKGLKSAIENDFIQNVNQSVTHEGLTFTIKDVILDSGKGVIFYSIESSGDHRFINIAGINLLDEAGERINASITWGGFIDKDLLVEKQLDGIFEVNFNEETILPNTIYIEITLMEANIDSDYRDKVLSPIWKFELPVDHGKIAQMERTYILNKEIVVDGQRVFFKEVIITPTRGALKVEYDQDNTKNIFRFDDIQLVDEKGEVWGRIRSGVIGTKPTDNEEVLYFQSNFFSYPEELYIVGSTIRALDKSKSYLEIDLENNVLLTKPDDKLKLREISRDNSTVTLKFDLSVELEDEMYHYSLFAPFVRDTSGAQYQITRSSSSSGESGVQTLEITFDEDINMKGPLYLGIRDYPEKIIESFKIKVK